MGFETSRFGDSVTAGAGNVKTLVSNHYGRRNTGKTSGVTDTHGFTNELSLDIDGEMVGNAGFVLVVPKLPAGSNITKAYVEVTEAFVLGGTTPAIEVGTEGSEATNGVTITEAQAEAVGYYDVTSALAGTWNAPLAAETTVGIALSGTSPTVTAAGKLRLVLSYDKV